MHSVKGAGFGVHFPAHKAGLGSEGNVFQAKPPIREPAPLPVAELVSHFERREAIGEHGASLSDHVAKGRVHVLDDLFRELLGLLRFGRAVNCGPCPFHALDHALAGAEDGRNGLIVCRHPAIGFQPPIARELGQKLLRDVTPIGPEACIPQGGHEGLRGEAGLGHGMGFALLHRAIGAAAGVGLGHGQALALLVPRARVGWGFLVLHGAIGEAVPAQKGQHALLRF